LEARLQRAAPLAVAEAVRIGREVAEGLAAAHAHHLIHRDLKPSNVWLEAPQGRGKILDFSPARPVSDVPRITPSCAALGPPAYLAPEHVQGAELAPRSDLFTLGSLLYEMTTGRSPFGGPTLLATLDNIRPRTPLPPRGCNPAVPEAFSALVMRLLAKQP